jgi:hypothetical protein
MMSLQALVEKSSDADLLREMIGFAAHRLIEPANRECLDQRGKRSLPL